MHKDDTGHNEADRNGGIQIDQNRQQQRGQQRITVASRPKQKLVYFLNIHHVPTDDNQNGRQTGQRNVFSGGRQQQHKEQQKDRLHNAGNRGRCTGFEIGGGAGNGAGSGNPHEEDTGNVGNALPDQLGIGIVIIAAHTVNNSCAQQRFNAGKKSDGQPARHNLKKQIPVKIRHLGHRQKMRNTAEFIADSGNIKPEDGHNQRCADITD